MSQQLNTELFTSVSEQDAAQVNGGNLGGFDWQRNFYASIIGAINPSIYYATRTRIGNFEQQLINRGGASAQNNFWTSFPTNLVTGGIRLF